MSYDTIKLSTESLEVSLQDSNINLNFRDFRTFFWKIIISEELYGPRRP